MSGRRFYILLKERRAPPPYVKHDMSPYCTTTFLLSRGEKGGRSHTLSIQRGEGGELIGNAEILTPFDIEKGGGGGRRRGSILTYSWIIG